MSHQSSEASTEEIRQLLGYLTQNNPYFGIWDLYKRGVSENSVAGEWRQFLREQFGPESEEEIDFTCAMVELDRLLTLYRSIRQRSGDMGLGSRK